MQKESFNKRNSRLEKSLRLALEKQNKELVRYYSYLLYTSYKNESNYIIDNYYKYMSRSFYYFYNYCALTISDSYIDNSFTSTHRKLNSLLSQIRNPYFSILFNEESENLLVNFKEKINIQQFNIGQSIVFIEKEYFQILTTLSKKNNIPLEIIRLQLYQESQLNYLQSVLLRIASLKSKSFSNNLIHESFTYAYKSIFYYPLNYLSHNILQNSNLYNKVNTLSQNALYINLIMYMCHGFNEEGVQYNKNGNYAKASNIYSTGINISLPGSKFMLYFNAAKNFQDYCYSIGQFNNKEIELSILYAYESIYDSMINLDTFIQVFPQSETYKIEQWLMCISLVGLSLEKSNQREKAISLLTSSISLYLQLTKNNSSQIIGDCQNNLGLFHMRNENYDLALEAFYSALENNPQNPDSALLNISNCYYQIEEYESAISICKKIISNAKYTKSHHNAFHNLILSYSKQQKLKNILQIEGEYIKHATKDDFLFLTSVYKNFNDEVSLQRCLMQAKDDNSPQYFHFLSLIENDKKDISKNNQYFETFINLSIIQMIDDCNKYDQEAFNSSVFYKFRRLNDNTFDMLEKNYLYFSEFSKLNDPFDCRLISEYINNPSMQIAFSKIGIPKVMSLSISNDNPLLWSHYADEHRGICIGYKFNLSTLIKNRIISNIVKYSDRRKPLNVELLENLNSAVIAENKQIPLLPKKHLLNSMILKSDEWEYEKEFRLISFGDSILSDNNLFTINNIDFGYLCSFTDIQNVIQKMVSGYGKPIYNQDSSNSVTFGEIKVLFSKKMLSQNDFFGLIDDATFNIAEYLK